MTLSVTIAPNIGAKAFAQVDNNSNDTGTLILEDMRAIMRDSDNVNSFNQQYDICTGRVNEESGCANT